jgi:LPXTG-motif cell wall-anchored protein
MDKHNRTALRSRLRAVIVILAVLLVLSGGGLAARYIHLALQPSQDTVTVPDNLIGDKSVSSHIAASEPAHDIVRPGYKEHIPSSETLPDTPPADAKAISSGSGSASGTSAVKIELWAGQDADNDKFEAANMFPGDTITKYYCIRTHHESELELVFQAELAQETKALGSALNIKVTLVSSGEVLLDAPFNQIDGAEYSTVLPAADSGTTDTYYRIDVYLDTSAGNEYQEAALKADFNWYAEDSSQLIPPPQTGDTMNFVLWAVLAVSALLLIAALVIRRRKDDEQSEQQ